VWDGTLDLVLSEPLLTELRAVLNYPKIRKRLVANAIDSELFLELLPFFTIQADLSAVELPRPRSVIANARIEPRSRSSRPERLGYFRSMFL